MTPALLRAVLAMYVYQTSVLLKCRDQKKRRRARRAISRLNPAPRSAPRYGTRYGVNESVRGAQ